MMPASSILPSATAASVSSATGRSRMRSVLIVSSDSSLRECLRHSLTGLRWQVMEAPGGAEAWMASERAQQLEAMLIDPWLPDLDVPEFLRDFHRNHPHVDLMMTDGIGAQNSPRSPYHQELLYALRRSQDGNTASWNAAPTMDEQMDARTDGRIEGRMDPSQLAQLPPLPQVPQLPPLPQLTDSLPGGNALLHSSASPGPSSTYHAADPARVGFTPAGSGGVSGMDPGAPRSSNLSAIVVGKSMSHREAPVVERIPELVGTSPGMLEVSRRIRLVAARSTPVLIEGPTGTGKELVAEALHRLSNRSRKPFAAINCAAIPEALLEAELFGHTRGAFTGAVQGRTGRIEAADGGTLFLDEIGEMPLALQSKLLRFFESGELQRIGDNETVKVDVRLLAATHQPLAEDAQKGLFRADLYYRLAVFLIRTPALADHMEDLPQLVAHFLERMGRKAPVKRIDSSAMVRLSGHLWPGNVRELEHVLERGAILSGDEPVITAAEIDFGLFPMN
jgi:DNA-binding NtrC family response regulator